MKALLNANTDIYVATTGAGAGLQQLLWATPGISSVLVGASFPYATGEMDDFLGFKPERYCSEETAVDLATAAYVRARTESFRRQQMRHALGLGITASVASTEPHRGDHRIHVAVVSDVGSYTWSTVLVKGVGAEDRAHDGEVADLMGLNLIAHALRIASPGPWDMLPATAPSYATALVEDRFWKHPIFMADGRRLDHAPVGEHILFPGTFNPMHDGHRYMAGKVECASSKPVAWLVNADSPHKQPLTALQLLRRVAMFRAEQDRRAVVFTKGQPLFVDKVKAFNHCGFIVGTDTLERMLDPKWGPDPREVLTALYDQGAELYVFERKGEDGVRLTVDDINKRLPTFETRGAGLTKEEFLDLYQRHLIVWKGDGLEHSSTLVRAVGGGIDDV